MKLATFHKTAILIKYGGIFEALKCSKEKAVFWDIMSCSLISTNVSEKLAASIFQVGVLEQHNTKTWIPML
jgi:hypothetical protein